MSKCMRWDSSQTHNRQSHHCTTPPQQHLQHNPQRKRTQSSSAAAIATTAGAAEAAVGLVVLRRHDAVLSQATHLSSCCNSGSDPLLLLFRDPSLLRFHFSHGHHQKQHVCRSTSTITATSCSQTSSSNHSRGYFLCHQLVGERWRDNFRRQSIAGCYTDLSRDKTMSLSQETGTSLDRATSSSSSSEHHVVIHHHPAVSGGVAAAAVATTTSSTTTTATTTTTTTTTAGEKKDVTAVMQGIGKQLKSVPDRNQVMLQALTNAAAHNLKRRGKPLLPTTIHDILPVKQTGSPQLYHSIYEKLLQSGRLQDCVVLLEEMDKVALLDRTKMNHLRFYQACKNQGAVKEAIRYTRLLQSSSTLQIYNMLLSVCRHARDTDGALRVLAMLESTGLKADCIFYTSLISACAKAGKVDLVFQIFHEMEAAGIEANVHTFAAMIDGCARAGQLPKAFGVYGIMISKNVKPDRVIFNTLINACGRAGAVERAFDVLSDMKAEATPVKPDHVTYGALIAACARGGQVDRALEVYKTMRANRIQGTPECYTAAVHACSQKGDLDAALSLYDDLKKDGVQPDEVFFSALIDVAGHSGQLDQAFSILQEMKRLGMKPGAVVYSSLMGVCSNLGNCNRAQELYKEIQATGLRPTVSTFNALMTTLCGVRQLKNALRVLEDMRKSGEAPNQISYSILLSACLKEEEPELAIGLYRTARAVGVTPSIVMCDSITGLCLQHIQKSAPPPQILSSICPVPAGSSNNAPHEHWAAWAMAVYRQTLGAGIVPTVESLSQLLGCLRTPEVPEPNYFDDRVVAFLGQSWPASPRHVVDGCGVYDPRALALFEEAAALGVVPTFSFTAGPIIVHAETMPVFAVEVCLLTLLKSLKHRHAAGARLPSVTVTYLLEKKEHFTSKGGQKTMNVAGRTGQAVTALLRRLRLKFQGHESSGEIHITVLAIRKWLQPNSTPQSFNPAFVHSEVNSSPYHQLVKNLSDQQRAIRMGGVSSPLEFAELDHIGGTEEEYNFKHSQSRRPKGPSEVRRRPPTLQ